MDDRAIPDLHFGLYDGIAALNHRSGVLYLVALGIRADAAVVLEELRALLDQGAASESPAKPSCGDWQWNFTRSEFIKAIEQVKESIARGEVYQVNLSQRARSAFCGDPLQLYAALRQGNPAPFSAYLDTGELQVLSTSPEQFLRKRGQSLVTRPIKGTRPRVGDPQADQRNAQALQQSEKERAELLMIVDLERNDLGRVAQFGSVQVEQLYHLEHYARVMHQTAQVKASLADGKDVFDCIRATFPGGSITGAPKVSAMQIIERLEPTRRGLYCGSVGYIGFNGDAEFNIAIRSLHVKDGQLDYQVGGGIVWDSDPASEYQETLDKGRAIRETIDALCLKS
jgi:para-aminobenzoate synthetase component 1